MYPAAQAPPPLTITSPSNPAGAHALHNCGHSWHRRNGKLADSCPCPPPPPPPPPLQPSPFGVALQPLLIPLLPAAVKHCVKLRSSGSYRRQQGSVLLVGQDLVLEVAATGRTQVRALVGLEGAELPGVQGGGCVGGGGALRWLPFWSVLSHATTQP